MHALKESFLDSFHRSTKNRMAYNMIRPLPHCWQDEWVHFNHRCKCLGFFFNFLKFFLNNWEKIGYEKSFDVEILFMRN